MQSYLVGYGTLLLRGSLGHSIGQDSASTREVTPVTVEGYRRLFNLRPTHYPTSHKLHRAPIENAALNVEPAEGAQFNGLAFSVGPDELEALDERERYYRRVSVPLRHFETGEEMGEGEVYASLLDAPWIERSITKLMPLWRDIVWSRVGAYRIGPAFGEHLDDTTYLADGLTRMVDVYREVLDDIDDVEIPT